MCIACELGYWSMLDALEAERRAAGKRETSAETVFLCEAPGELPMHEKSGAPRPADEPGRE